MAAATTDAEEHKRQVDADRDRILAQHQPRPTPKSRPPSGKQAAEDARADRDRQVEQLTRLQGELTEARERAAGRLRTAQRNRAQAPHGMPHGQPTYPKPDFIDADQRVNELRSTYETRLANEQARHTSAVEPLEDDS